MYMIEPLSPYFYLAGVALAAVLIHLARKLS